MTRRDLALALLGALTACQPSAEADPVRATPAPSEPPPSQRFERDLMTRLHMHASFDTARAIERLLIRGKLEDARYFARSLASEADVPGLEPWGAQIALVRERATAVGTATSLDDACRAEALLAAACATCHAAAGAQPEFRAPPALPVEQQTVASRMARHQWAADRLWEGMIGDAEEPWRAGLDVLAAAPLTFPDREAYRAGLALRLQHLADQARHPVSDGPIERSRLYGEILVTCEACHASSPK